MDVECVENVVQDIFGVVLLFLLLECFCCCCCWSVFVVVVGCSCCCCCWNVSVVVFAGVASDEIVFKSCQNQR